MLSMLFDLRLCDKKKYGAKASALGELMRSGEDILTGFALSSDFFMKFLEYNRFPYTTEDYLSYNAEICEFILNGQFSYEMEINLLRFFNNIEDEKLQIKYVVRSSALCEDSDAYSMAGMFSSFIGLSSFEEVKVCIKKCYASLFSDKVIAYFIDNNLSFEELKMCVLIQQFAEGEYSGVNFSVDTIDMNKDIMHINVVNGLCEDYVSGKSDSAFYKIDRETAKILEEKVPENFSSPSKDIINRLYETTLRIERMFGKYQDIEWTISNNRIFILQARPITTFKIKEFEYKWEDKDKYNHTWYLECDRPYEPLINEMSIILGEAINKGCYTTGFEQFYTEYCVQNGYFYYRDKQMTNQEQQEQNFLAMLNKLHSENQNIFQDIVLPKLLILKKDMDNYIFKELQPQEAIEFLEKAIKYMEFLGETHLQVTHGCDYLDDFMTLCKQLDNDFNIEDLYDLVFNVSILNKERALYIGMVREINMNPVLNKMFANCQYNEILYARLKRSPEAEKLLILIEKYMKVFGICCLDSDVSSAYLEPLLFEAPSKVIRHLRGFLNINAENFRTSIENSLKNKDRIKSTILSKLNEEERRGFLNRLNLAEKAYLARDDHHYYFERMTRSYLRLALMELQRILTVNKQIEDKTDIYFLTLNEIKDMILRRSDLKSLICERKDKFNYQKKLFALPVIGKEPSENVDCNNENTEQNVPRYKALNMNLKGLSGLRKKVNGKVKIGMPEYLEEDCILVLPFTRCGQLEPIINHVKGIIVEIGSPFEHVGILTREMGVPVLYGVKKATTILNDGDEIQLDGILGEVKIIKKV